MMAGHFRRAFVSTRTTAGEAIEPGLPRAWCDRTPGHRDALDTGVHDQPRAGFNRDNGSSPRCRL